MQEQSERRRDHLSTLYQVVEHIDPKTLKKLNKEKKFEYGFNKDWDFVCISKDGTVGEFYKVRGLVIGVPSTPEDIYSRSEVKEEQYWDFTDDLDQSIAKKIKDRVHFQKLYSEATGTTFDKLDSFVDISEREFSRRENGFWFMNNGKPTYITGSHYFYLRWAKIDVGAPDYRDANRIFFYFWEACKADNRSYGMCYLKNRRSGFSFMSSSEIVNQATVSFDSQFGMMSKTGEDAKRMFTRKVVPISLKLPFFFKPIRSGEERPKTMLEYAVPSERLTKKKRSSDIDLFEDELGSLGNDTVIDYKNTGNNSYDGEKLKMLIFDEAGKIDKKNGTILESLRVHKTCLELGSRIVGKTMVGSTCNALDKGGREFKDLFYQSDLTKAGRDGNGQTPSGLYALFIPMEFGLEGFIDRYGMPVFETPEEPVLGIDGGFIDKGVLDHHKNKVKGLKNHPDALNEYHRQYPRTEDDAFRDEATNSLFNLSRIYDQIQYNNEFDNRDLVTVGSFQWENGIRDTKVIFVPNPNGRFKVSWIPAPSLQNRVLKDTNGFKPEFTEFGAFGCDSYDISGTVDGGGSKGALHGLTAWSMNAEIPQSQFFLEYIARPQTAEIFYEDVLMAIHFYGMPILVENNKPRLLYYLKERGYRRFSLDRPDKRGPQLSVTERELGGIPNTSEDIRQIHASSIETYIEEHVGTINQETGEMGKMPFNRTLEDWAGFDITKRTKYDASISSGLAIMAVKRNLLKPTNQRKPQALKMPFSRFNNSGSKSRKI